MRAPDLLLLLVALVWGTGISLAHGRLGFMPLDQSIVYDGAWRVLHGQVPYRDFFMPMDLVPILLQAAVFRIAGVTWAGYCLHAALVNGLFAALAYLVLRRSGLSRPAATTFSLLSGLVLYPPFGVPGADQHAFFFGLAALSAALAAAQTTSPTRRLSLWALTPVLLSLAVLSKQLSGALPVVLVAFVLAVYERKRLPSALTALLAGALASVAVLLAAAAALDVDWDRFDLFFWRLSAETGASRVAAIEPSQVATRLLTTRSPVLFGTQAVLLISLALATRTWEGRRTILGAGWRATSVAAPILLAIWIAGALASTSGNLWQGTLLIVVGCLVTSSLVLVVLRAPGCGPAAEILGRSGGRLVLAQLFLAICLLALLLVNNDPPVCLPYLFLAAGLVYGALRQASPGAAGARWLRGVATALLILCVLEGVYFEYWVNTRRYVHQYRADRPQPIEGARLDPSLAFLRFDLAERTREPYPAVRPEDFVALAAFLRAEQGSFFLLGDSSILYAALGRPSVNPCLWFHFGLSMPRPGTPDFAWYEERLLVNLQHVRCRFVVLEGQGTFMGARLRDFPRLEALVRERELSRVRFGPLQVIEIRSD